jgi:small-conductance mechanosensitive channel
LWERPIRVGDLVVVGDGEGYVRRINVRATEIETFDRSTVVVPNSNLISGVVRNRVRTDRTGRVIVTVPVPRASDPDQVAEIMRTCALAHREVMSEPSPRVLFKKITDASIEFDLVCFVDEIETSGRISSDLYFAIYRCLRQSNVQTRTRRSIGNLISGISIWMGFPMKAWSVSMVSELILIPARLLPINYTRVMLIN